jgi:hypothetical protein
MYILSTVHVACRWVLIKNAFIDHADSRETTVIYLVQSPLWLTVLAAVVFTVNTLVSDSILVLDLPNAWFHKSQFMSISRSGAAGLCGIGSGR